MMKVCRQEPRKSKTAIAASVVPINPDFVKLAMELRINCDSSKVVVIKASGGIIPDAWSCLRRALTPSTTLIVLASGCF